jgi:hypothetical protein
LTTTHLQKNLFFAIEEDIAISRISRVDGPWVLILPHLWWGRVYLLLGIHHTLVWNRVLQYNWGCLLQVLLWDLLRGRKRWRMWRVHGFFHSFEVRNLGAMVNIMSILTTKSTREFFPEVVFVVLPLAFVVIVPFGVMVTLILVSPSRLVLLEVVSTWSCVVIVSFFSFLLGIIQLMGRILCIQLFKSMNFLNGRGLNKVIVGMWLSMWRSNWLWMARKWKVQIFLWQRSIGRIGR